MKVSTLIHYSLKILAYALCAIGCFYQVVSILNLYFSFPTTVFSFVEIMNKLDLPAITLCNNNRIMLSKLKEHDTFFNQSWSKLENKLQQHKDKEKNKNKEDITKVKLWMQKLIDKTVRKLMDTLSVEEFALLGNQWSDMLSLDYFKCATDPFNLDKKCIKYSNVIESAQEVGNCFTIFRRSDSSVLKSIAIKSGLSQSPVIRGTGDELKLEFADQPFNPNEIFRIMVNFSVNEYTTLNEMIMGYIMVHDENELPPIREKHLLIYPGFYYEFYINKETGKYLPSPYITDCIDYNLKSDQIEDGFIPQVLSKDTCIMNCMAEKTVNKCNCWPPELPYIVSNSSRGLKWCSWREGANIQTNSTRTGSQSNWFSFCFASHEKECQDKCKTQCQVDNYSIIRQSFIWPSNERITHSKKYNRGYRICCALISIRFWSAEQSIQQYQPKYEFVEFISYFGGLLSIWLGFSLVKSYDILELVVQKIFKNYFSQQNKPQETSIQSVQTDRSIRPRVSKYLKSTKIDKN